MVGFLFDLFSYSGLRAFFTSDFTNWLCPPPNYPTIRCYYLEHFSQVIYELYQIMPPPQITRTIRCCSQHLMVGFFFDLFSYSGLRAFFTSDLTNCTTDYAPPPKLTQPSGAVHSIWWLGFFLTSSPILDLEHFSQVIYELYYRLCPPQINPTIRCCSQHLMVGVFFWPLFLFWT